MHILLHPLIIIIRKITTLQGIKMSVRLEVGGGLGRDKALTRPADILVSNLSGSASAAYDITVTSPLNPSIILEAGVSAGTAAKAAEVRKHSKYYVKCSELTYGAWGCGTFSLIASRIAIITNKPKSMILSTLAASLVSSLMPERHTHEIPGAGTTFSSKYCTVIPRISIFSVLFINLLV